MPRSCQPSRSNERASSSGHRKPRTPSWLFFPYIYWTKTYPSFSNVLRLRSTTFSDAVISLTNNIFNWSIRLGSEPGSTIKWIFLLYILPSFVKGISPKPPTIEINLLVPSSEQLYGEFSSSWKRRTRRRPGAEFLKLVRIFAQHFAKWPMMPHVVTTFFCGLALENVFGFRVRCVTVITN